MASYRLLIKPSAAKEFEGVPTKHRSRYLTRIQRLPRAPRPSGSEKVSGHDLYRIRQGTFRVLYTVDEQERIVLVIRIGPHGKVSR